jgi:hypothetical protein
MIEGFPYKDALLPKIWLQKLPGFGELTIPKNYPESSSEFSLDFTPEETDVIREMEANLNTEESIVTPEMIPENTALGNYLGTFDVTGEAGVETLLSPIQVSDKALVAIAMHYNAETDSWDQIEDAHIAEDGYVYGTVESFSPIAVFTTRRDTFIDTTKYCTSYAKALICNGIPVYIHLNEENKPVAEDGYGKVIDLTGVYEVIGGAIDGSDLDSTSVTVDGVNTIYSIRGGSFSERFEEGIVAHVKKAAVTVKNVNNKYLGITGGYCGSITDEFILNIENSTYSWNGAGESIWQQAPAGKPKESGTSDSLSKGRTKKAIMNIKNSKASLVFLACNCGLTYTDANEAYIENCEFDYLITGGSNGGTGICTDTKVVNSKINIFQTNNRGYVNEVEKVVFDNCTIEHLFIAGDSTDSTVTGVTNHIGKFEINGKSDVVLYVGTQNGQLIASNDELKALIDKIAISRDTKYTFGDENGASLFGDLISIK